MAANKHGQSLEALLKIKLEMYRLVLVVLLLLTLLEILVSAISFHLVLLVSSVSKPL